MVKRIINGKNCEIINTLGQELNINFKKLFDINSIINDNNQRLYGYFLHDKLIGFLHLTVSFEEADIVNVIIQKEYRHRGIGTELINYAVKQDNLAKLNLEVRESNKNAIAFYQKLGFQEIRIIKNYYQQENAIFMVKKF
mgnify:CR=1 FL=1